MSIGDAQYCWCPQSAKEALQLVLDWSRLLECVSWLSADYLLTYQDHVKGGLVVRDTVYGEKLVTLQVKHEKFLVLCWESENKSQDKELKVFTSSSVRTLIDNWKSTRW